MVSPDGGEGTRCGLRAGSLSFSSPRKPVDEGEMRLPDFVGANLFPKGSTSSDTNEDHVIAKVLRISTDDRVGLSQAFVDILSESKEISEIIASHSFLPAHDKEALAVDQALRLRQRKDCPADMWKELVKLLTSEAVSMDTSS